MERLKKSHTNFTPTSHHLIFEQLGVDKCPLAHLFSFLGNWGILVYFWHSWVFGTPNHKWLVEGMSGTLTSSMQKYHLIHAILYPGSLVHFYHRCVTCILLVQKYWFWGYVFFASLGEKWGSDPSSIQAQLYSVGRYHQCYIHMFPSTCVAKYHTIRLEKFGKDLNLQRVVQDMSECILLCSK